MRFFAALLPLICLWVFVAGCSEAPSKEEKAKAEAKAKGKGSSSKKASKPKKKIRPKNPPLTAEESREFLKAMVEARNLEREGENVRAAEWVSMAMRIKPNDPQLHLWRGNIHYRLQNYRKAIEDYKEVVDIDEKNWKAYVGHADASWRLYKPKEALDMLKKAIKIDPSNPIPHRKRGEILHKSGDWNEASKSYQMAMTLKDKDLVVYFQAAKINLIFRKDKEAIKNLDHAIAYGLRTGEAYHMRAKAYRKLGNLDATLTNLNLAIAKAPNWHALYFERANIYDQLGQGDKAKKDRREGKQKAEDTLFFDEQYPGG